VSRISKNVRQHAICLAMVCFVIGLATTAFAVPPEQVLKLSGSSLDFTGPCCFSFNESISVTEPAKPVAVVVTWEVFIFEGSGNLAGLMLNGGPCTLYGSGSISGFSDSSPRMFQWVIFPSDGLRAGSNTLTLCGGGISSGSNFLDTFGMTLAARLSN
jgi:hypothetical protein